MTKELEERLAALEAELQKSRQTTADPQRTLPKASKKALLLLAALLVITAGGLYAYTDFAPAPKTVSPFTDSIRQTAAFSLYYPKNPPQGLQVDAKTISSSEQAVTYAINQNNSPKYQVSIQAMPSDFDFSKFKQKFQDGDEFIGDAGSVFIGDAGNGLIGSIRTKDGSWIILTTSDYTAKGQISELSRSFQKIPK